MTALDFVLPPQLEAHEPPELRGTGRDDVRMIVSDRETGEVMYGRVPAGSVVVSGNLPSKDGSYSLYCAVIVKKVDEKTRGKVGINELLRGI